MPGFKKNRIRFRLLELSDATYICRWLAATLHQSPEWESHFLRLLLEEWHNNEKLTRQTSWMALAGEQRLFFLEIAAEDEVFLTAPPGILDNRLTALAVWQLAIAHLRSLRTLPGLHVTLEATRDIECECLLQLGFIELAANGFHNQRVFKLIW
ncbi:hypothetical protein [Puia sp.]|jgi:hypothetical protein|uniref:hypothetical protein n=1 Tax=Puia sp. TaxID=2045100 RepID=UPI002F411BF3